MNSIGILFSFRESQHHPIRATRVLFGAIDDRGENRIAPLDLFLTNKSDKPNTAIKRIRRSNI
jgi:hypothetical protein